MCYARYHGRLERQRHGNLYKKGALVLTVNWIEKIIEPVEAVRGVGQVERSKRRGESPAEETVKVKTVVPAVILGENPQVEVRGEIIVCGQHMLRCDFMT